MAQDFFTKKLDIVKAMQKADRPLIIDHISRLSKVPRSLVRYHVKQMVEWGVARSVELDGDEKSYYMLQPAYYDENWLAALYAVMTPYVTDMTIGMDLDQSSVTGPEAVVRNLSMFLRLFEERIEKLSWKLPKK